MKVTLEAISVDNKPEELLDRCVKLVKVSSKMNCDFLEEAKAFSWCIALSQLTTLSQRLWGVRHGIVWTNPSLTCSLPREANSITQENFKFNYYNEILNKLIVPDQEEVSFEWSLHTISFRD